MQRTETSRSEVQWDFLTNTWEFVAEELLAVRVQRHGTTGKWPSSKDTLTSNVLQPKWKKSPPSLFQVESKSTSISDNLHDDWSRYLIIYHRSNIIITHFIIFWQKFNYYTLNNYSVVNLSRESCKFVNL